MEQTPIEGVFEFVEPCNDILLYEGPGAIDGVHRGDVRISMHVGHFFGPRWRMDLDSIVLDPDGSELVIDHPNLGRTAVPILMRGSRTTGAHSSCWGSVQNVGIGRPDAIERLVTNWVNLPAMLPSSRLTFGSGWWKGRWQVDAAGWFLTLDSRQDLSEVHQTAADSEYDFTMTHVSEIRRFDSAPFSSEEAGDVLFAWQLAMSFALGRWVAPLVPVGFSSSGDRVWEVWAPWRCDTFQGHDAWWDTHTGEDLKQFVGAFISAMLEPDRGQVTRHVAMHLIAANHGSTTAEGQVMLAYAGIEYLTWVSLVLAKRVSEVKYFNRGTAWGIRRLLREADIPLTVPEGLKGLRAYADRENLDGPSAVSRVRHLLVHPKDADTPYQVNGLVWEAAQLLMEYGELLLLHRLNYTGRFMRRYPPARWAHTSEAVPWASAGVPPTDQGRPRERP